MSNLFHFACQDFHKLHTSFGVLTLINRNEDKPAQQVLTLCTLVTIKVTNHIDTHWICLLRSMCIMHVCRLQLYLRQPTFSSKMGCHQDRIILDQRKDHDSWGTWLDPQNKSSIIREELALSHSRMSPWNSKLAAQSQTSLSKCCAFISWVCQPLLCVPPSTRRARSSSLYNKSVLFYWLISKFV